MIARRAEDTEIMTRGGWKSIYLDFLDAPYRTGGLDTAEVANAIQDALPPEIDTVAIPSGIGLHADHVATRDASLAALKADGHSRVVLYADLPYAAYYGWAPWVVGANADPYLDIDSYYFRALGQITDWVVESPTVIRLSEDQQAAKLQSMRHYRTQFSAMEAGPSRWLSHPERLPYELLWQASYGG